MHKAATRVDVGLQCSKLMETTAKHYYLRCFGPHLTCGQGQTRTSQEDLLTNTCLLLPRVLLTTMVTMQVVHVFPCIADLTHCKLCVKEACSSCLLLRLILLLGLIPCTKAAYAPYMLVVMSASSWHWYSDLKHPDAHL